MSRLCYRFADCELDPLRRVLQRNGADVSLTPRAFDVLLVLVERAGHLVTKDQLLQLVWPDTVVEENNLQVQVSVLRRVVGVTTIATIPRRGYRFTIIPETHEVREAAAPGKAEPVAPFASGEREASPVGISPGHSVPAERDDFVGRIAAMDVLDRALSNGSRLVSVVGIGGGGKTRLVNHFARETLSRYPGGAWFCDLSQARTLDGVAFSVAQGLRVPLAGSDVISHLAQVIARRNQCLVILDNFEQVARFAEDSLGRWIDCAPEARFLVTSREVLGIVGEQVLQLPPLTATEGIELFRLRASSARIGFAPNTADVQAISQIVVALDGLPLAIELAAARVRLMPPQALVERMGDRFQMASARGGRPDRQLTLQAAFDWSWDLLSKDEKVALSVLSVFRGGFTLHSACEVLECAIEPTRATVDAVQGLVDKSFVRVGENERFTLLETVREYSGRRLRDGHHAPTNVPSLETAAVRQHYRHFASLEPASITANRCAEAENLVAACGNAASAGDGREAALCLDGTWRALRLTGPFKQAMQLADVVSRLPSLREVDRALAHWVAGDAAELLGEALLARQSLELALACARQANARVLTARILVALGTRDTVEGKHDEARSDLEQALDLATTERDDEVRMDALNALGVQADRQSRLDDARSHYEQALLLARALQNQRMEGAILGNLAGLLYDRGDLGEAQSRFEVALDLVREAGDRRCEGNTRCNLGLVAQEQGKLVEAKTHFEAALGIARAIGYIRLEYMASCNLGILLTKEDHLEEAADHFQHAIEAAVAAGDRRAEGQFRGRLAVNLACRSRITEAREALAIGEALVGTTNDHLSYGLILCDRAQVEVMARATASAKLAYDKAREIATKLNCSSESELAHRLKQVHRSLGAAS